MNTFTVAEVAEITGVKEYVLRYWENYVPQIAPKKDINGRKLYTQEDLKKFLRLRHLIFVEKYTIEGAALRFAKEIDGTTTQPDVSQRTKDLAQIRDQLLDVYNLVRKYGKR